ncbi:MAG: CDP-glycerol glycerophosphotransferase family protein [Eubacteriaceae bacterium]|nr:CDP-glycerol glycerophosphotransferase family protein [Eubacteriaceae bacterium]
MTDKNENIWVQRKKKIKPFFVEGRFLRRSFGVVLRKADRRIGIMCKKSLAKKTKVNPKKITFITFQGDYTCNPKYICEELKRQNVDCEIVWASKVKSDFMNDGFPDDVEVVKMNLFDFYEALASSKIWIANSVEFLKSPIYKKPEQVFIETWHGSLGIKRFGKGFNNGKGWVRAAELTSKICDYVISNSDFEDDVYRDTFWQDQKIWKFGHPRNDMLVGDTDERRKLKKIIHEYLHIDDDTRILLYAPTFRDSHTFSVYDMDYKRVVDALEDRFGGNWVIVNRFHPTVKKYVRGNYSSDRRVLDATHYPDIQDLIAAADIAVTDYSSWIYDFVLTKKPGFIFARDLKDYYSERGFYYPLESTPFPVCTDNDMLVDAIENFDEKEYDKKVKEFLDDKGCIEDGHAAERVVEEIKKILAQED